MKIAFSVLKNLLRGGGIEKYTYELGRRLVARGHTVTVFSMGHYGNTVDSVDGMHIVQVPSIPGAAFEKLSAGAGAALKMLSLSRDVVIHYHATGPGLFAFASRLRGHPCVLQLHGIEWQRSRWNLPTRWFLMVIEKLAIRQSHICTAVSQVQCEYVKSRYGFEAEYIPTGADIKSPLEPREIARRWGLTHKGYILFASRLVREKGAHYLIPAFRKLDTAMNLVIAGDAVGVGSYKQELVDLAGNDPRIIFPGFVEGDPLQELFSNAAFFVQPSEVEGLSIALLEAMSFGLGCLVSDIPENREAIGPAGMTFRNKDIDDLSYQLNHLLQNPSLCDQIGSESRERVRLNYSWDAITDRFETLYRRLATNHPSPHENTSTS